MTNTKPAPIAVEEPADAGVDAAPLDILVGPHPVLVPLTPPAPLLPPYPKPAVKPEPCYGCGMG